MITKYINIWRHPSEIYAAMAWAAATVYILLAGSILPNKSMVALSAFTAFFAVRRFRQAGKIISARMSISTATGVKVITAEEIRAAFEKDPCSLFTGFGWEWSRRHTQRASEILARDVDEVPAIPRWLLTLYRKTAKIPEIIGSPWIHGLEPEEIDVRAQIAALEGHTLIVGTTGSGKTRLYEILTSQAIYISDSVVIIFDPKGDGDWEERCRKECERTGREFLKFHPAFPSQSIRLNPLKNWHNPSEVASRISQLLPSQGGGDNFVQFAWMTIDRVVNGLLALGIRPTIKNIKRYVEGGVDDLLSKLLDKYFLEIFGPDWEKKLTAHVDKSNSRTHAKVSMYVQEGKAIRVDDTIDALVNTFTHDKEHYGKMILSLLPLLQMLTTGELGEMLSPNPANLDDPRPAYDLDQIIRGKKVLYIGLDSLSNKQVGSAIGSVMLADLASVAGAIYNYGTKQNIYLFVDEANEVVNDQFIQILNKARGAGFKSFFATQTLADLEAKMGSKSKATQMLGNANNVIVLRLRDTDTAKYIADMFDETVVTSVSVSQTHRAESVAVFTAFGGSVSRSLKEEKEYLIPPAVLKKLPNLQYISLFGGRVYKGRIPVFAN